MKIGGSSAISLANLICAGRIMPFPSSQSGRKLAAGNVPHAHEQVKTLPQRDLHGRAIGQRSLDHA
jgi:hypothetical protein